MWEVLSLLFTVYKVLKSWLGHKKIIWILWNNLNLITWIGNKLEHNIRLLKKVTIFCKLIRLVLKKKHKQITKSKSSTRIALNRKKFKRKILIIFFTISLILLAFQKHWEPLICLHIGDRKFLVLVSV